MNRRQLLKVGVLGAAVLGTVSLVAAPAWRSKADHGAAPPTPPPPLAWSPEAEALIAAVAMVLLGPACAGSLQDRQRAVTGVKTAVSRLSPAAQSEVGELLTLLTFAPARSLVAGVWTNWDAASAQAITGFLQRWRHSRLALLQSGYHALHDLVLGSWYADPQTWASIGYPGPPAMGLKA